MPNKRVIQAGHLLGMVFVSLLLAGARQYLLAHPLLSGLLLAAFAVPYYSAARITGTRQFLYPAVLLAVLAYHLLLVAFGLPAVLQPLYALFPLVVINTIAGVKLPNRPERASESLYGANCVLVAAMSLWILFRLAWFYQVAPLPTALALAGFGVYLWIRFRDTEKTVYAVATVVLGSGAFLFLLYSNPRTALVLATAAAGLLVFSLRLPWPEAAAFGLSGAYSLYIAIAAVPSSAIPLGYLAAAAIWLLFAFLRIRSEQPDVLGPLPAAVPRVLPFFGGGIVLAVLPVWLFYPWQPVANAVAYLAIFSLVFAAAGTRLGRRSSSLIGIGLGRLIAALGRIGPFAAFIYIAAQRFPAGLRLAAGALGLGLVSLLWAYRQHPKFFARRNYYAYQAGVFLIVAYFLAERRLVPIGSLADLASGAGAVLFVSLVAWLIGKHVSPAARSSLYEVASVGAMVAAFLYPTGNPIEPFLAAQVGLPLLFVSAFLFLASREIPTLFAVPVVLAFWLYVAEWVLGVRGERLGIPYLLFGFAWAAAGYWVLRQGSSWYRLLYFMWFLSVVVSLALFWPNEAAGAWLAPLWPVAFVLVARGEASRRDVALAWALEGVGAALAISAVAVLVGNGWYAQAAFSLFVCALLYAWVAVRSRIPAYVYPAAASLIAAFHLGLLAAGQARLALPLFLVVAGALSVLAFRLRDCGHRRAALPLDLAAAAGAAAGAAILLFLPFGHMTIIGGLAGLAYLLLYLLLASFSADAVFLAGAGLAGAFAVYQFLPALPAVTAGNRIAFFIPVALVLAGLGRRLQGKRDLRGAWALYAAAIFVTVAASFFVLGPVALPAAARLVLVVALVVWLALLISTEREIFIYCATLTLAILAYHFVQNSTDLFGRHLVGFFLWGTALLGLVFLWAVARGVVRFRRPTLFLPPAKWRQRLLYGLPVGLLAIATFGSWGVATSSNPIFCGSCHEMNAYFSNWRSSAHAKSEIGCPTCHYQPGLGGYARAKMQGFSELVVSLTGTQASKPAAKVSDRTCLQSGCHSVRQLTGVRYARRVYYFNHAIHLGNTFAEAGFRVPAKNWRGPELRCTTCHTDTGPESHFSVDTNACFTCHFEAAGEPRPAIAAVGCVNCHAVPQGERGAEGFVHATAGVTPNDDACAGCHAGLSHGSAAVEERQCRHCHIERSEELLRAGAPAIHQRHVRDAAVGCDWCHGVIRHRRDMQPVATARVIRSGRHPE